MQIRFQKGKKILKIFLNYVINHDNLSYNLKYEIKLEIVQRKFKVLIQKERTINSKAIKAENLAKVGRTVIHPFFLFFLNLKFGLCKQEKIEKKINTKKLRQNRGLHGCFSLFVGSIKLRTTDLAITRFNLLSTPPLQFV